MTTAINPQTGERVQLVNGQWKPIQSAPSGGEAFTRNASSGLLQNVAQVPMNYLRSVIDATGVGPEGTGQAVAGGLTPAQDQILGAGQVAGEKAAQMVTGSQLPVSTMQQATQNQAQITQAGREAHPIMSTAGDITGDVAMLAGGRAPASGQRAMQDFTQARGVRLLEEIATSQAGRTSPAARSWGEAVTTAFAKSPLFASVTRGTTKAAEAGLDGMALGLLNEQDPVQTAAIGAGAQVGGSLMLSALTGTTGKGNLGLRLAMGAAGIAGLLQFGRSMTPGEDSASVPQDIATGIDKIVWGVGFGLAAALGGGGRITGTRAFEKYRKLLPTVAETTQTLQRGVSLSALNRWLADDRVEPVMRTLAEDPMAFGSRAARRIERAITNPDVDLTETLDGLMRDREFRNRLEQAQ